MSWYYYGNNFGLTDPLKGSGASRGSGEQLKKHRTDLLSPTLTYQQSPEEKTQAGGHWAWCVPGSYCPEERDGPKSHDLQLGYMQPGRTKTFQNRFALGVQSRSPLVVFGFHLLFHNQSWLPLRKRNGISYPSFFVVVHGLDGKSSRATQQRCS